MLEISKLGVLILVLIVSVFALIVLLVVGFFINGKLEQIRRSLPGEKGWRAKFADTFYNLVMQYNQDVSECVQALAAIQRIIEEIPPDMDTQVGAKQEILDRIVSSLSRTEWAMRVDLQVLVPHHVQAVQKAADQVSSRLAKLLRTRIGNLAEIESYMVEFNKVAMDAHKEIVNS